MPPQVSVRDPELDRLLESDPDLDRLLEPGTPAAPGAPAAPTPAVPPPAPPPSSTLGSLARGAANLAWRATPAGMAGVIGEAGERAAEAYRDPKRGLPGAAREAIYGIGEAALPMLAPLGVYGAVSAPMLMGAGAAGGYVSGKIARGVAEEAGAGPDVADIAELAGDVAFPAATTIKGVQRGLSAARRAVRPPPPRPPAGLLPPRRIQTTVPPRMEDVLERIPPGEIPSAPPQLRLPPPSQVQAPPIVEEIGPRAPAGRPDPFAHIATGAPPAPPRYLGEAVDVPGAGGRAQRAVIAGEMGVPPDKAAPAVPYRKIAPPAVPGEAGRSGAGARAGARAGVRAPEPDLDQLLSDIGYRVGRRAVPGARADLDAASAVRNTELLRKNLSAYIRTDPATGVSRAKTGTGMLRPPRQGASQREWDLYHDREAKLGQLNEFERQLTPEDFQAYGAGAGRRGGAGVPGSGRAGRTGGAVAGEPPAGPSGYTPDPDLPYQDPYRGLPASVLPRGERVKRYGAPGRELSRRLKLSEDLGEQATDERNFRLTRAGLQDLGSDPDVDVRMFKALEGRDAPASPAEERILQAAREITDEIRLQAETSGAGGGPISIHLPDGSHATFRGRGKYAPHIIPRVEVLKDTTHPDYKAILKYNLVDDLGMSESQARDYISSYVKFVESGERPHLVIAQMLKSGQARDTYEAEKLLERFRTTKPSEYGQIESARVVDLPLYIPRLSHALPHYVAGASKRLAQIKELGQSGEVIGKLLEDIKSQKGKEGGVHSYEMVKELTERILRLGPRAGQTSEKISLAVRALETQAHIGLSTAIPNMFQATLWGAVRTGWDVPAVAKGLGKAFTKAGREASRRGGAVHESAMRHLMQETGASPGRIQRALNKWTETKLKITGFTSSEELQRHIAYAIGEEHVKNLARKAATQGPDPRTAQQLIEFGLDPARIQAGDFTPTAQDLRLAGKRMSDMVNFRNRPIDLPHKIASPESRIFWQFKNYMYNATLESYRATVGEMVNGRFGEGLANFLKMTVLFGASGAVVNGSRSVLRGYLEGGEEGARKRLNEKMEPYGVSPAQAIKEFYIDAGQLGMGAAFMELIQSAKYRRTLGAVAGPGASTAADLAESVVQAGDTGKVFPIADWFAERVGLFADFFWPSMKESVKEELDETRPKAGARPGRSGRGEGRQTR